MPETNEPSSGSDVKMTTEIEMRIAEKVRGDSQNLVSLVSAVTINKLLSELDEDGPVVNLADMQMDERFQDIESVVALDGAIYLYSSKYITESQAEILVQTEDIKPMIAEKVRDNSKNFNKLTGIDSLFTEGPALETEKIKAALADMQEDDSYHDIKPIFASTGALYLYSDTHITDSYASILARAEANDPCATIASTVRDESRIYPRPTSVELFKESVFNIDPVELETHVSRTIERQEFKDIKMISVSTGVHYLYSDLYMNEAHARSLAEWEEVEQYDNP
ncbi:hypothetical protein KAR91_30545 [Candidatus Pacearchaeota archaeon]|nr:hypothetical protein [Candidatus Pacearchaeota archaeon]